MKQLKNVLNGWAHTDKPSSIIYNVNHYRCKVKVDREYFMWQISNLFFSKTIKDTTKKFGQ